MNELLFGSGEQGAWYDPSDLPTLFQDTAGTAPVTAVEQAVALMLDKSGRGNHASQATSTKRFLYSRRVNLLVGSTTLATQSITTRAAGYKIVFSGTGSVTLSGTATGVYGAGTNSITCTAGTLTLTVSGSVQDASFHLLTDSHLVYQGINTDTDYDADPNKFPAYLACDGIDDAMRTGNIDFTGTDKMTVWAGVGSPIATSAGAILTHGGFGAHSFQLMAPGFSGENVRLSSAGTAAFAAEVAEDNGSHLVVSGSVDTDMTCSLRQNGLPGYITAPGPGGGGNYQNLPLIIGDSEFSGVPFNGRIYPLIVRGAQSSLSQIEAAELHIRRRMMLP
ncbi:MAG: hypothetical protein ACTS8S_00740 [Giesbergeria sp.]